MALDRALRYEFHDPDLYNDRLRTRPIIDQVRPPRNAAALCFGHLEFLVVDADKAGLLARCGAPLR